MNEHGIKLQILDIYLQQLICSYYLIIQRCGLPWLALLSTESSQLDSWLSRSASPSICTSLQCTQILKNLKPLPCFQPFCPFSSPSLTQVETHAFAVNPIQQSSLSNCPLRIPPPHLSPRSLNLQRGATPAAATLVAASNNEPLNWGI